MKTVNRLALGSLMLLLGCPAPVHAGWENFNFEDGEFYWDISAQLEHSSGDLWFSAAGSRGYEYWAAFRYDGMTWTRMLLGGGQGQTGGISAMAEDTSGNIWVAVVGSNSQVGVHRIGAGGRDHFTGADGLADDEVHGILGDSAGNVWFAAGARLCGAGVSRFDGESWVTFTTASGLADDYVTAMYEDASGNLWFGTQNGLSRYDGSSWTTFTTDDGLAAPHVSAITQDDSGHMWFATSSQDECCGPAAGGGVSEYDGTGWTTYTTEDGLADNEVYAVHQDGSGDIWFATATGVSRYDGIRWVNFAGGNGFLLDGKRRIVEDDPGALWFGSIRYDGSSWTTYATSEGLAGNEVRAVLEDHLGDLWVGTMGGVSRYDGLSWNTYTIADGLAHNEVRAVHEDGLGNLWFGTNGGVSRYDRLSWTRYAEEDGLAGHVIKAIVEDGSGNLWFGGDGGVSRLGEAGWSKYTSADGAPGEVTSMCMDSTGVLWCGSYDGLTLFDGQTWERKSGEGWDGIIVDALYVDGKGDVWLSKAHTTPFSAPDGVFRYDGTHWTAYSEDDGLASNKVIAIVEDESGNMWFGTTGGVSRFDGANWTTYRDADGLAENLVGAIEEDSSGRLWFGTYGKGLTMHELDKVPPQAVIWPVPERLGAGRARLFTFTGGFKENTGLFFSTSVDGSPWSPWTPQNFWVVEGLVDGPHAFRLSARDKVLNVDSSPDIFVFEVDGTAPSPEISGFSAKTTDTDGPPGEGLRDTVMVIGSAADPRFKNYGLEVKSLGEGPWTLLSESSTPVDDGVLAVWNTLPYPDGEYVLRVTETDTLGLVGATLRRAVVDNYAPWSFETAPATVSAATGGHIYTTHAEVHLYFPPHALPRDFEVTIETLDAGLPDTLGNGARSLGPAYTIWMEAASLEKPATIELRLDQFQSASESGDVAFAIYERGMLFPHWTRLGGTVDPLRETISAPIAGQAQYALFVESTSVVGTGGLSALSITPRVFSPSGGYASNEVAIGFTLGRADHVTARIYNRAGRLVCEVASGQYMTAGANLLRWNGLDRDGRAVEDGLYMVTVEALGARLVKPLAVVR